MKVRLLLSTALAVAGAWAQPPALYSPGPPVRFTLSSSTLTYRDAAGEPRTLGLTVRTPAGDGPFPVVVWSHSADLPASSLQLWSDTTAEAGYLTVTVDHPLREVPAVVRLCAALKVSDEQCPQVGQANWDRPHDLTEVLDWLAKQLPNADQKRIAVAGQADGASAALSLAGARRLLTSADRRTADDFLDERPLAFVALSPHSPQVAGFFDVDWREPLSGYQPVARPVMVITGAGDNNCSEEGTCYHGDSPARRRTVHEVLPAGGKVLMFFNSVQFSHELIGTLEPALCQASKQDCDAFQRGMPASVLAFLDAHVRQRQSAQAWLSQAARRLAAAGNITWEAK